MSYSYCLKETDPSENPDILYYLHAGGGSERSWESDPVFTKVYASWRKNGAAPPSVVSVSFGPRWILAQSSRGEVKDLHALFVNVLMNKLETQFSKPRKGQKLLVGNSMGGFNAAMLYLKNGGLFHKVALLCPAIPTVGPFSSPKEVKAYIERTGANADQVNDMLAYGKSELPTLKLWEAHDPIRLANALESLPTPSLYVTCGDKDEFGFFEGSKKFASILQAKPAQNKESKVIFEPIKGGTHCAADAESLAKFLVPKTER